VVIIAVVLHNTIGLLGGYWGGKLFGLTNPPAARWRSKWDAELRPGGGAR
jgi:hypothetical protein